MKQNVLFRMVLFQWSFSFRQLHFPSFSYIMIDALQDWHDETEGDGLYGTGQTKRFD